MRSMTIRKLCVPVLAALMAIPTISGAQEKSPVKFGKITPADFNLSGAKFDTSAEAVVIADIGSSEFLGNTSGWFSLQFRHFKRIKILNKKGFDAANIEIPLYVSGNTSEKVDGLKAYTYNLENGKVVETKLEDKSIFTDKISKYLVEKKFTFPALKEGSIIEYSYVQNSEFISNLQPWEFQGPYPCLWSEYEVDMPNFFQYVTLAQGLKTFDINNQKSRMVTFHVTIPGGATRDESGSFEDQVVDHRWVMKDIPALKDESYMTTTDNYISKLEFQLSRYSFPNTISKDKMGNWFTFGRGLMEAEDFGGDLKNSNSWMDEECKNITKGATTSRQKAEKIYAYVRDNFTCTQHSGIWMSSPLKKTFKDRNGNVAAINILLAAMLNHEHIPTQPVVLSTRAHGFTHEMYPLQSRFNYVICRAEIDSSVVLLDASETWLGFGHIPNRCYNGHARVITPEVALPIYLEADSVTEGKITMVFMSNEKKGYFSGRYQSTPGYFASCAIRERVRDRGQAEYFKAVKTSLGPETEISDTEIDSLKIPEERVAVAYDFAWKQDDNDVIYFSPMLSEAYKENPFSAAERKYPVEMPHAMDDTYTLTMDVPEGYEVEELPKSTKVLFNDDEGFFEYLMYANGGSIQFRSRIKLKKANFKPEDYATLRDFFTMVVKKQNEQIVFKKKK